MSPIITLPALPPASAVFNYGGMKPDEIAVLRAQADRIRKLERTLTSTVIELGNELLSIKSQLGHGRFGEWVEAECGFTQRTAVNYISAAKFAEGKTKAVSDLPPALVYHLASKSAPPEIVHDVIALLEKGEGIDPREVEAKLHEARRQRAGYPFNLIGPNGEKPDVVPDGWLWSEKKRTLYKKPNPPRINAETAKLVLENTTSAFRHDASPTLTDATEKVEPEPEVTAPPTAADDEVVEDTPETASTEQDQQREQNAFLLRADEAKQWAFFDGEPNDDLIRAAMATASAWRQLADAMMAQARADRAKGRTAKADEAPKSKGGRGKREQRDRVVEALRKNPSLTQRELMKLIGCGSKTAVEGRREYEAEVAAEIAAKGECENTETAPTAPSDTTATIEGACRHGLYGPSCELCKAAIELGITEPTATEEAGEIAAKVEPADKVQEEAA